MTPELALLFAAAGFINDTNLIEDCVEISHESDGQRKRFVDVIK